MVCSSGPYEPTKINAMPEQPSLKKAQLLEVDSDFKNVINKERALEVQFNPETLKVSFSNQVTEKTGDSDAKTKQPRQFVSTGSTKLALQLWFDVSVLGDSKTTDVRELTKKIVYFLTPTERKGNVIPPSVRFLWGTFQFDGIMDSIEESLEFFSPDGRPLRASVSLAMSRQEITINIAPGGGGAGAGQGGPNAAAPGTRPMTSAPAGSTLQGLTGSVGGGVSWQAVASANGIENPRLVAPGMMIDLNASVSVSATASASADVGVSGSAGVGGSIGF